MNREKNEIKDVQEKKNNSGCVFGQSRVIVMMAGRSFFGREGSQV